MQAMQDVSVLVDENGHRLIGSCPPERITLLRLIRSFSAYARSHSENSQGNAAVAVIKAFEEAFPCHRETASSEDVRGKQERRNWYRRSFSPASEDRRDCIAVHAPPRDQQTPEALAIFERAEIEKWWPILRAAGIKGE
jgi:Rap1a immunity proteins